MAKPLMFALGVGLTSLLFPFALYTPNLVPAWLSAIVAWFALVPIALLLHAATPGTSFRWAYLFGLAFNVLAQFWIFIAIQKYGNLSPLSSGAILLSLVLVLALYPAWAFWMMARLRGVAPSWLLGSLFFVLLEWTRVYFPLEGYPWCTPAYALRGFFPLIQAADVVGVAGLNFLIFLSNFVLAEVIVRHRKHEPLPRIGMELFVALFLAALVYGIFRERQITQSPHSQPLRIALLQGNIPQDMKWDQNSAAEILNTYRQLTLQAAQHDPDLIVWPEAAVPFIISQATKAFPFVIGASGNADLVIGAATSHVVQKKIRYQNSAFVVKPNGRTRYRYDKQHLVPFGEYVPLSDILPMNSIIPSVAGNFEKGASPSLPTLRNIRFGILICYELLFPELSVDYVRKGARFLVNITNDAWFEKTSGPYQHFAFGTFRAIETRRPIVRVANTGITTWYDPLGHHHEPTKMFTRDLLLASIHPREEMTFYVRHPNFVGFAAAALLILSILGVFRPKVRSDNNDEADPD